MRLLCSILKLRPLGGKERDFLGLMEIFAERGHDIVVLTGEPPAQSFSTPIHVVVEPIKATTNHGMLDAFCTRIGQFRQNHPGFDAVVSFDPCPAADFLFVTTRPHVGRHLHWRRMLPRYQSLLRQEGAAFNGNSAPFGFFLCTSQAEEYRRHYHIRSERFAILPVSYGQDRHPPDHFYRKREHTRHALGIGPNDTTLIQVALNGPLKGLDRSIDLLTDVGHARLLVVGDDSPRMRRRARRNGVEDRVHFLGYRRDVPALMEASDLTVHPARQENTGTVIVESLICGVPVIASGVCGYAEHIERSGAGIALAEPFNQAEFLTAVREVLQPPAQKQAKAAARRYSRILAQEGGLERVADTMLATIKSIGGRPE